jgi:hypothetical protein
MRLGCSISMLWAVVDPCAVGMMRTCSPTARSEIEAVALSLVTVVDEVTANVLGVPLGSVTVIEELVRALTTPPGPMAHTAPAGALAREPSAWDTALDEPFTVVVDALATPAPVAMAPRATTAEMPTRLTIFFFVDRYMGGTFLTGPRVIRDVVILPTHLLKGLRAR